MTAGHLQLDTAVARGAAADVEAGYETVGREVSDELGSVARAKIAHFLQRKVDKERMSAAESESCWRLSGTGAARRLL